MRKAFFDDLRQNNIMTPFPGICITQNWVSDIRIFADFFFYKVVDRLQEPFICTIKYTNKSKILKILNKKNPKIFGIKNI